MSVEQIIYILRCQHRVKAQAFYVSGLLHCPLCHEDYPISGVETKEWRANCRQCRYARWAGMSEVTAEIFANGHVSKNPGHMVGVNLEGHLAAIKTKAKMDAYRVLPQS